MAKSKQSDFNLDGEEGDAPESPPETVADNNDDETDELGLGDLAPAVKTVEQSPAPDTMAVTTHVDRKDPADADGGLADGGGVADRDGDGETKSEPAGAASGTNADLIDAEQDREYGHTGVENPNAVPVETPPIDHTTEGIGERHYFRSHGE